MIAATGRAADAKAGMPPMSRKTKVLVWVAAVPPLAGVGLVIFQLFFAK
jgi:hypothetical protein